MHGVSIDHTTIYRWLQHYVPNQIQQQREEGESPRPAYKLLYWQHRPRLTTLSYDHPQQKPRVCVY